jgi:transcriptional regulator with XRE-family HTH domain
MVTDIDLIIGKRLRLRRIQLGLSQHDVASVVGVRFQQIQKYECGSNRIAASRLWLMSQALDTSVSFFFEGLAPLPKVVAPQTRERRPA